MHFVVAGDAFGIFDGFVERFEREQAFTGGDVATETGFLDESGSAGGEIADCTVAEPAAVSVNVDSLGDRELSAGVLNVMAESMGRIRNFPGFHEIPSIGQKRVTVFVIVGVNVESDFELLSGAARKFDELAEFMNFDAVAFSAEIDGSVGSAPTGDGGEAIERGGASGNEVFDGPLFEDDRRASMAPTNIGDGNFTVRRADVFSDGEIELMVSQARATRP